MRTNETSRAERLAQELGAERAELGTPLLPMLCEIAPPSEPIAAKGWLYELKLDGVRLIAERCGEAVKLVSRRGREVTATYPEVVEAVRGLEPTRLILDGEVVAFDDAGRPSFGRLQRRMHLQDAHEVSLARREVPVLFIVFDVLAVGPWSLLQLPLARRREVLAAAIGDRKGIVRALEAFEDDGRPLLAFCEEKGLEGIVAKRADSIYRPGIRTRDWLKIKRVADDDFVVIGFTVGQNARSRLGAIDVASHQDGKLVVRGKVGSGLTDEDIERLLAKLAPLKVSECAAEGALERAPRGRTFVRPEVVIRVRYQGWTHEGRLRAPVYVGMRDDVPPEDCDAAPPE